MLRCWPVLLVLLSFATPARAQEPGAVHMTEPRGFGHFVGDIIQRTAEVEVADGETFVGASLPQTGQLAYWLELKDVEQAASARNGRLSLKLTYQLFYVPIDTHKVKIPASNVEVKSTAGSRIVTIPAVTFLISPIREIYPEKSGETSETFLKADAPAEYLGTGGARTAALISALATAVSLMLFARHRAWWPFHTRPGRPFTTAERMIGDHRQNYGAALIALHRAFDQSRGERLLAADLDGFFMQRPEQGTTRQQAERFFHASQTYFFAGDVVAAEAALPRSVLDDLAGDLAANERAAG